MPKNCPFGEGIALVLCVAKSCTRTTRALVYEVFKMAAQYKRTQHCRPEKEFFKALGPVSRKSRNFSGAFRVTQFFLYLQNGGVSRHETLQLFLFLFTLQRMKRSALQNKQVVLLRMAFRARKVLGAFEKRAPGVRNSRQKGIRTKRLWVLMLCINRKAARHKKQTSLCETELSPSILRRKKKKKKGK